MVSKVNNKKIAVVLLNLGGPDSLKAVKPFLFNLFYDKLIIRLPNPWRFFLAKLISNLKSSSSQKLYQLLGGKSPLLSETEFQADLLQNHLNKQSSNDFKIFISMRYWHPLAQEVINSLQEFRPDKIIILPLYPHFSTATTLSSILQFDNLLKKNSYLRHVKVTKICCYPNEEGFIKSYKTIIEEKIKDLNKEESVLVFSAHSLPEKFVRDGDPYQWQIEESVKLIVDNLFDSSLKYVITYQSKVGFTKWLQPSTEVEILRLAKLKKNIVVVPISFVSEHVETLVELDLQYAEIAKKYNANYIRIPTLRGNTIFIDSLEKMVLGALEINDSVLPYNKQSVFCSKNFKQCLCNR